MDLLRFASMTNLTYSLLRGYTFHNVNLKKSILPFFVSQCSLLFGFYFMGKYCKLCEFEGLLCSSFDTPNTDLTAVKSVENLQYNK